jgi:hypothetical protein
LNAGEGFTMAGTGGGRLQWNDGCSGEIFLMELAPEHRAFVVAHMKMLAQGEGRGVTGASLRIDRLPVNTPDYPSVQLLFARCRIGPESLALLDIYLGDGSPQALILKRAEARLDAFLARLVTTR